MWTAPVPVACDTEKVKEEERKAAVGYDCDMKKDKSCRAKFIVGCHGRPVLKPRILTQHIEE